jgi:hypothetical protein
LYIPPLQATIVPFVWPFSQHPSARSEARWATPPFFIMPPGRRAANIGLSGKRPAIGDPAIGDPAIGAAAAGLRTLGVIIGMIVSLFGFLMLVHVLNHFMMFVVTSSMLTVVVMMMLVTIHFMFFHVMNMVLVLMMMLMASWMNVLFVLVMFHDVLTFCGDESCRHVSWLGL